jgi:hypothetical protein
LAARPVHPDNEAKGLQVSLAPPEKSLDMSFVQYANNALK